MPPAREPLDVVFLGRSITSSWASGHATTYRALVRALAERGHRVRFLERDAPRHARHRDLPVPPDGRIALYDGLAELRERHAAALRAADLVVVGSGVPDGREVCRLVQELARGVTAFYDLDTPVTLERLARGACEYLAPELVPGFDLYLSFTGGPTLARLEREWGARAARSLYGSADPEVPRPGAAAPRFDLGYVGTYSADRQPALDRLLVEPARRRPELAFVVAGPEYPGELVWPGNVARVGHLPPGEHAAFYAAQRYALNVTRADRARAGYSPSIRLFEAAACATPVISDTWAGLETVFEPGREILVARSSDAVLAALRGIPEEERRAIGERARQRLLREHTAEHRARALEGYAREAREARARRRAGGDARHRPYGGAGRPQG